MGRWSWLVVAAWVAGVGCSRSPEPSSPPVTLEWEAEPGADRYEVQAWSGFRLLFEEEVAESPWELSPNLTRTVAEFDSVVIRLRALDPGGEELARRRWDLVTGS